MNPTTITFDQDHINGLIDDQGLGYVAIRTIANAIGLHADSALTAIKNDEILGQLLVEHRGTGADKKQYLMQFLPIDHVNGWLFSIDINKVNPQVRPKLQRYKKDCYRILHEHFNGKAHKVMQNVQQRQEIRCRLKTLNKELKNLKYQLRQIDHDNETQLGLFVADTLVQLNA